MPLLRFNTITVFTAAVLLRVGLLVYGIFQDNFSAFKYTDIDYYVFTDASRFMAQGRSPYDRDTYRYTPILAWLLLPTTWSRLWFSFGKVLFAAADIVAGFLILLVLRSSYQMSSERALKFASIWLLNPMVATISTRGSSEGLLGVTAAALLWAVTQKRILLAGFILGFAVHFKIYPFIYAPSIIWWLDQERLDGVPVKNTQEPSAFKRAIAFFNRTRISLALYSFAVFMALNGWMFAKYGWPFVQHSYLHHFTRIDHRHNFSPYNTLLYLNSSPAARSSLHLESLAFVPQLLLSTVAIPIALAKKDLATAMLAQTFAFVTFNKVCTSQYFLWYLIFLPFYLPTSSLLQRPALGITACVLWVLGQALWLQQGYRLEFLGISTFTPGLWLSGLFFFLVNCWILGIVITDVRRTPDSPSSTSRQPRGQEKMSR
ncbi:GPI mannosyltransferas-like protein 1 [Trichodelitschia bisporula]|uniref:GPI mannosyltransferase 1 n=1 Tax=Trichodelitschia bisporula TaxID=703511 RepID=A0A6G1I4J9_9PEZI|nr:GPI mannosyltransferas-like protein 1 [Trichodelitschia bisporula]